MLSSGFKNAPVSEILVCWIVVASILASITDTKYYFFIHIFPHLWGWGQLWRLFVWQFAYTNSSEVLFAALTFYHLRVVERLWGTRKFLSFILLTYPWTSLLPPLLLTIILRPLSLGQLNYIPAGPTPLLFALLAQWQAAIPAIYKYKIGTTSDNDSRTTNSATSSPSLTQPAFRYPLAEVSVTLSSKSLHYVLPLQLALSQFPHSLLPAAVGWGIGHAYRNEVLPGTGWRVPGWLIGTRRAGAQVEALRRRLESEAIGEGTGRDTGRGEARRRTLGGLLGEQFWGRRAGG